MWESASDDPVDATVLVVVEGGVSVLPQIAEER